jgi:hypothetical protein
VLGLDTEISLAVREEEKGRSMKGGEQVNIHIILKKGMVVGVYDLSHPEVGDIRLEEEFDYKVEDLDEYEVMDREGK